MSAEGSQALHSLSGMPDSGLGASDELAAAASVLAMAVDSDSEEELVLEVVSGDPDGDLQRRPALELSSDGEEHKPDLPDTGGVGAAIHKVSIVPRTHPPHPRAPPLTC